MKRRLKAAPATGWDVFVTNANKSHENYYDYSYKLTRSDTGVLVPGQLAVRLTYNGKSTMTYGVVNVTDPKFDDLITTMKAEAQEKASALNAVGAVA